MKGLFKFFVCSLLLIAAVIPAPLVAQSNNKLTPLEEDFDIDAQAVGMVKSPDGVKCAVIKVYTSIARGDLQFRTDMAHDIEKIDDSILGQIWVYLWADAKQLQVFHAEFNETLAFSGVKAGKVYKTTINHSPNIQYAQVAVNTSDYFTVTSNAPMSSISMNGGEEIPLNEYNTYSSQLEYGSYSFQISAPNYRPYQSSFVLSKESGKVEIAANLVANFCDLYVTTTPESGVQVSIDGVSQGVTPLTIKNVNNGEHKLRLQKSMYKIEEEIVQVGYGGGVQNVAVALTPTFVESSITVANDPSAQIYMNGTLVGTGSYTGRIPFGTVKFEARKESHRTVYHEETFASGASQQVVLDAPAPIYGILRIEESAGMPGVEIRINNKSYGTAPTVLTDILVGDYTVELVKNGYRTYTQQVTVDEAEPTAVKSKLEKLVSGKVYISTHSNATLYDGDFRLSRGTYSGELALGTHTIKSKSQEGDVLTQGITVTSDSEASISFEHYSKVTVTTNPSDAEVEFSRMPVSKVGNTYTLTPGGVTLTASKKRYKDSQKHLTLEKGNSYSETLTLVQLPSLAEQYYETNDDFGAALGGYAYSYVGGVGISSMTAFPFRYRNLEFHWLGFEFCSIDKLKDFYVESPDMVEKLEAAAEEVDSEGNTSTTITNYRFDARYVLPLHKNFALTANVGAVVSDYFNYGIIGVSARAKCMWGSADLFLDYRGIGDSSAYGSGVAVGVRLMFIQM